MRKFNLESKKSVFDFADTLTHLHFETFTDSFNKKQTEIILKHFTKLKSLSLSTSRKFSMPPITPNASLIELKIDQHQPTICKALPNLEAYEVVHTSAIDYEWIVKNMMKLKVLKFSDMPLDLHFECYRSVLDFLLHISSLTGNGVNNDIQILSSDEQCEYFKTPQF
jgi:hypothetical protein